MTNQFLKTFSLVIALCVVAEAADLTPHLLTLRRPEFQSDFPSLAIDSQGTPWIAYVEWDGTQDKLFLATPTGDSLTQALSLGQPGIIHQPALAVAKGGLLIVVWSQVNDANVMELKAQRVRDGRVEGDEITLATSENGGNVFARAATDRAGRVWVVWQAMRGGLSDVFCRTFDPVENQWSPEVQVTRDPAGEWEPCVAFDAEDGAWVIYDSSRGNEFNIYANRVSLDGEVGETKTLIADRSLRGPHERRSAHPTVAASGSPASAAINNGDSTCGPTAGNRDSTVARTACSPIWDLASDQVEEMPSIDPLLAELPGPVPNVDRPTPRANNAKAQAKAEAA